MEYKVGDRVKIKSFDWYNENKDSNGFVHCGDRIFDDYMSVFCNTIVTIGGVYPYNGYGIKEDMQCRTWTDEMIEGLVEEEALKQYEVPTGSIKIWDLPSGYIFKDERGNEIHALKIVLEKANTLKIQSDNMETETHRGYCTTEEETTNESKKVAWFTFEGNDFADKVELSLSNRELIQEDGKWFVVKKKKEYPKTFEECCKILGFLNVDLCFNADYRSFDASKEQWKKLGLMNQFYQLLICRDVYWKLYGEEMGLGKPWKPDLTDNVIKHCIEFRDCGVCKVTYSYTSKIFAFPTPEMRDVFKENFKELIEICKGLL